MEPLHPNRHPLRILIVTATEFELRPLPASEHVTAERLVTGVGMVATAVKCAQILAGGGYDLALNFGLCGSFDPAMPPGTVVHVTSECMPELGAEDGDGFLELQELKLLAPNQFPYREGRLRNEAPPAIGVLATLPCADGITVNTVHGNQWSIADVIARYRPQVESMDGAAFMYACLVSRVPFAEVRAVSNVVERRNRAAWKLEEAIEQLELSAAAILEEL